MGLKRYQTEQDKEGFIAYVHRTRDIEGVELDKHQLKDLKERLLKRRAVHVNDALRVVNARTRKKKTRTAVDRTK